MAEAKKYRIKDEPISLDEMKQFLWGAATRLRGQIDATGYKEYIFPLLFFKRISDVYDEQYAGFVCEGGEIRWHASAGTCYSNTRWSTLE